MTSRVEYGKTLLKCHICGNWDEFGRETVRIWDKIYCLKCFMERKEVELCDCCDVKND